jgi:hypothetical protein
MLDSKTAQNLIKPEMPVVCSQNGEFAKVECVEGLNSIKLKDMSGQPHYIPLAWVTSVDDKVHVDRTGDAAMAQWSASPIASSSRKPS